MIKVAAVGGAAHQGALQPELPDAPLELVGGGVGIGERQVRQAGEAIRVDRDEARERIVGLARPGGAVARRQQIGARSVQRQHLNAYAGLIQRPKPLLADLDEVSDLAEPRIGLVAGEVASGLRGFGRDASEQVGQQEVLFDPHDPPRLRLIGRHLRDSFFQPTNA